VFLSVIRFWLRRFAEGAMPAAVRVTRQEHSPADLRQAAKRSEDADAARRMLALALVLEGTPRGDAATSCGMERQTLRDWVHRYNAEGLAGLSNRPLPGAAPRLNLEQKAEVARWVRAGPDLARHGVVRWRRRDLRDEIAAVFGVRLAERTVGALLHELGFSRISVRPHHPRVDRDAQAAFKKTSPRLPARPCRSMRSASLSRCGSRTKPGSASRAR
jgi:transposase